MYLRKTWVALVAMGLVGCGAGGGGPEDASVPQDGAADAGVDAGADAGADASVCVDVDGDGYGDGCALGPDCDDSDTNISPAASEVCDGVDNDCNDMVDDGLLGPSCGLTVGVCVGATASCGGSGGFAECGAAEYGTDYEADETACDGLDNDCDGTTDEGCTCTDGATQPCGSDIGVCMAGTQTCVDSAWGACSGETGPMGEVCDGMDNDCDGTADEAGDLTAPTCPLQLGVCTGATRTCGGAAGWIACSGVASYGGDYQAVETLCDGLDNNCDGVTDEGCECIDGATQACGTDVGACSAGTQTCTAGSFGGCAGEVPPGVETCDGTDEDCDGIADNNLVAPACALAVGVCAGSVQPCNGASGFAACGAADYGSNYETDETSCDGQDNDCDGETDEGCECVDGTTQACGLSAGACERGTQTCAAGAWGACMGGTDPVAETCNGADDDCNGTSDDNLTAPACALTMGVCMGTTQRCGGASGWEACVPADYGASYVVDEDGAADEGVCDGLDNDCDGTADEGCTSGPILSGPRDLVEPELHNQHLVYLENFDGNWDVAFVGLSTGATRRLTTTPENESTPRVYGNHVVYSRGVDAASRVFVYDLTTGTETMISTRQSGNPDIAGRTIVYDEFDGTQWDIYLYDLGTGMRSSLYSAPTPSDEIQPTIRGARIAYTTNRSGDILIEVLDLTAMTPTPVVQTPGMAGGVGQYGPILDYAAIGWVDGRNVTDPMPSPTSNWDTFGAWFLGTSNVFPGEAALGTGAGAQVLTDIDGALLVWSDRSTGDWNPVVGQVGGTPVVLSTHPALQGSTTISGNVVVWHDNRRGTFDLYATALTGAALIPNAAGQLFINEILADPATDANGDGTMSTTQDEFVEILNAISGPLDLSGATLSDGVSVRHTFPAGTVVPAGAAIIVFGGGAPTGLFGGAIVQTASSGSLGLNNRGDTLTLTIAGTDLDVVTYGPEGNMNQSIVRQPEIGSGTFVLHSAATGSSTDLSPGTSVGGFGH